jgi:membrane fusion protein, multidrug efflux system
MPDTSGKRHPRFAAGAITAVLLALLATLYYVAFPQQGYSSDETATGAPPARQVPITAVTLQSVRLWTRFAGRLTAVNTAEIKPRVSGEIQQVLFQDGQLVERGELLFVIDPRPYQAAVQQAKAQLASAESRTTLARDELARASKLVERKLVSDSIYDAAKNEYQVASAMIREAESAVVRTELDLQYAHIKAPFSGRISRAELTVGNLVEAGGSAPVLATLVSNQQLYAEFNVDEQTYLQSIRTTGNTASMPVELTLANDDRVYRGKVHAFDNQLDISSGTIRARAIFDNTDGALTPGMYANVQLGAAAEVDVLLIPTGAVGTNQDKKFVYVVGEDHIAAYREVTLGQYHKGQRVVLSGLQPGDQVVINGLAHIRPGMPVDPTPAQPEAADTTAE